MTRFPPRDWTDGRVVCPSSRLTDRSVRLLSASAAGVLLADSRGQLRVAAASSEAAELVELFQIQNGQGPCLDCGVYSVGVRC
jgi:hypothetical protein